MMATLLEVRQVIKRFYAKYDIYVKPVLKFVLALVSFMMLNIKIGFMEQIRNPLVAAGMAVVCAFLPFNALLDWLGSILLRIFVSMFICDTLLKCS